MPHSPESNRRGKEVPDGFQRQREADLAWIQEYLEPFAASAREQHHLRGRGAIVIDTNVVMEGAGHPVSYLPQAEIESVDEPDIQRLVRNYRPETQMVIVLLKHGYSHSTYTVFMPPTSPQSNE